MDRSRGPGDVRPGTLAQPPGSRYQHVEVPIQALPRMRTAWLAGLGAAVGVAVVLGLLRSTLEVGMFAVSALGGFLIGWSVRRGAWQLARHRPSSQPELAGAILGLIAWLLGLVAAWVVAQAILPASERSLPERLAATPWLDWLLPQLGAADVLSLVLLVALGLAGARSTGIPETPDA